MESVRVPPYSPIISLKRVKNAVPQSLHKHTHIHMSRVRFTAEVDTKNISGHGGLSDYVSFHKVCQKKAVPYS